MKKILSLLILVLAFAFVNASAQKPVETVEWVRVEQQAGEFSVEMPSSFAYFYDKDGFTYDNQGQPYNYSHIQMLNAAADKTVMSVEIYQVPSPKKYLNELIERLRVKGTKSEMSEKGVTVKQFTQNSAMDYANKKEIEISFVSRFIATKDYLYVVTVANRGAQTEASTRFLSSIRLNQPQASSDAVKVVKLSDLKPLTIEQIGEVAKDNQPKQSEKKDEKKEIEKPASSVLVLSKPFATYTNAARNAMTSGTIRLRATFDKDGRVSKIAVLSGLENGLTRSAFFAALRIKFIPQEMDNELVTVSKVVEYSFNVR